MTRKMSDSAYQHQILESVINQGKPTSKRNSVGFKCKGSVEQELIIEIIIEKLALKQNTRLVDNIDEIIAYISGKLTESKKNIPFSFDILKDELLSNQRVKSLSVLVNLNNDLIGVANLNVNRCDRYFNCAIFNDHREDFEKELNDLISSIDVQVFTSQLLSRFNKINYFCKKYFEENPLDFIEKNSDYIFQKEIKNN